MNYIELVSRIIFQGERERKNIKSADVGTRMCFPPPAIGREREKKTTTKNKLESRYWFMFIGNIGVFILVCVWLRAFSYLFTTFIRPYG